MRAKLLGLICVFAWGGVTPCSGQVPVSAPTAKLSEQCDILAAAHKDAITVWRASQSGSEKDIADGVVTSAFRAFLFCNAVKDLGVLAGLSKQDPEHMIVALSFARDRIDWYQKGLDLEISELTGAMILTHMPGIAISAESLRDKVRTTSALIRLLDLK